MRVLMVTSEWPSQELPAAVPFLVQRVDFLRRAGVELELFAFRGRRSPFRYASAWRRLRQTRSLSDYDVIDCQFGQSGLVALPAPVPLVVTLHGSDLQGIVNEQGRYTLAGRVLRFVSRVVADRAAQVIIVAGHLKKQLPAGMPVHLIPCGLDMELFKPMRKEKARAELGLPQDRRLILFAADPRRPVKRFALAQATVKCLNVRLDAELLPLGSVPHKQMPLYMNACDALLLTSSHEGSPTAVKEALACNLPVVSTDVGDVLEQFGRVSGCRVCKDDRAEVLADALYQSLTAGMESGSSRAAIANMDERLLVKHVISVYELAIVKTHKR